MTQKVIGYHKGCHDGFCSAAVATYKLMQDGLNQEQIDSEVNYVALNPNKLLEGITKHLLILDKSCIVRIFDVSFNPEAYQILNDHFDDLVIFDHHKSTVNNFEGELPFNLIYQVADCGAIMAWKNYLGDKPIPLFLKFICARDTWKWNSVPNFSAEETKIICLGLYEACRPEYLDIEKTKPNFINWFFFLLNDNWLENIIEKGETLKNHQNIVLKDLKKSASLVKFGNHTVCVCNSPIEISDLGNQLAAEEECDYALIWRASGDRIAISLRSIGDFDVSEIAEQYPPGGGHRNAAAFSCPQHLFCLTSNNLFIPTMNQKPQFLQKMAEFYLSRLKQQIEG